ncbi:TIGR04282 family arsenosugar biosynthesis glycosyltransferase [Nocardia callitridis]|uniref:DUF2064 domain-containing protein n=1 Tax=Nocardia callitridis TaxID=648753 RepID=A0ABP9JUB7_9NOCA
MSTERAECPDNPGTPNTTSPPHEVTLLVIAKAPIAWFAKTRLTPPLAPVDAARVAAAALLDTLDAVRDCTVTRRVIAFTGDLDRAESGDEISRAMEDFEVFAQRGGDFGTRLANAHADAARFGAPVLQIGMDTPQVGASTLIEAARRLTDAGTALLGPAEDGGWWALGLPNPQPARVLAQVPMSTAHTATATRSALRDCGYGVRSLPRFRDVDDFDDALHVADHSGGRFAEVVRALRAGLVPR